jgi:hypothetical protein
MTTQSEYLDELGLSTGLRNVLARSARQYENNGTWVDLNALAYEAAEANDTSDPNEVFRLPQELGHLGNQEELALTGLGLLASEAAPQTSGTLAQLARICADRKLRHRDSATLSAEILVNDYGYNPILAARCDELMQMVPGVSAGGSLGENWSLTIFRGALQYRNVNNANDLFEILKRQADERRGAMQRSLEAASLSGIISENFGGNFETSVFAASPWAVGESAQLEIFVLMSFAPLSTGVYEFIRRSVNQLNAPAGLIKLYRADDIADPGKITDQIERAIETASVVVADITGLNPNVMWELGYASAYRKPLVILNQDPEASPFDLKPVRQVSYDAIPTAANQEFLLKHLIQALLAAVGDHVPEWLVNAQQ